MVIAGKISYAIMGHGAVKCEAEKKNEPENPARNRNWIFKGD